MSGPPADADLRSPRRGLGAASRQRSLFYNWDRILQDVLSNYREVLNLAAAPETLGPGELAVAV